MQRAITCANADTDLCGHLAQLGHNELINGITKSVLSPMIFQ